MQLRYQLRKKQDINSRRKNDTENLEIIHLNKNLHTYLIDLILNKRSENLANMSIILRKYLHASWLCDESYFAKLQSTFLIQPLYDLFKEALEKLFDRDIKQLSVETSIRKIFYKFFDKSFVDEYCITLLRKSSKILTANIDDAKRKTHIFGLLNQVYTDSMEGYALVGLSREKINYIIKRRIPVFNQISNFSLTEENFENACTRGFYLANKNELAQTHNSSSNLSTLATAIVCLSIRITDDQTIRNFTCVLAIILSCVSIYRNINSFVLNRRTDSKICNNEKLIHQNLMNQLVSTEILDELINEREQKPKIQKSYQSKTFEKPIIVSKDTPQENDSLYVNPPNCRRDKIRKKKIKIEESINEISQEILTPMRSNISITWNVVGIVYTYNSNDAISNIIKLSSDDAYYGKYAQNNYVYFDEDIIWKMTGDKVKYQQLKNTFEEGKIVKSINETGFTYRPDENANKWLLKLKVVHKKGMGHLSMFFKTAAKTKSVDADGQAITSRLYMAYK